MRQVTIIDIRWERAILELEVEVDAPSVIDDVEESRATWDASDLELQVYRVAERRFIPFELIPCADPGRFIARLNVTQAQGRAVLSKGQWIICRRIDSELLTCYEALVAARSHLAVRMRRDVVRLHAQDLKAGRITDADLDRLVQSEGFDLIQTHPYDTHGIAFAPQLLNHLDACSRFFPYAQHSYAYAVQVRARETSEHAVSLFLDVEFYQRKKHPRMRWRSLRFWEKQVFGAVFRAMKRVCRRSGDRILFFKENGDGPTENMAAFQQRLVERGLDERFKIVHRYRNVFGRRQNPFAWLADLWAVARADYIFIDDYTPLFNFITLDEQQVLTQLWHAGVGFKSVGYARFGLSGSPDPYASGHRSYTYALVGNEHLRDIYAEVFGIEREALLATGMPRLDHFLDDGTAETARASLYARYPRLREGRVILFAPTFRGAGQRSAYYPYEWLDNGALYAMCEATNSFFVYEMHHFIKERPDIASEHADRILDLTNENLNELFHIADVLITDYSSCFYDFLLLDRPVVLFVPDKLTYAAIHGVQRPIDEMAPGEVCETFDELLESLTTRRYEEIPPRVLTIDRAAERSGLASDRAIDTILLGRDVPGVRMVKRG